MSRTRLPIASGAVASVPDKLANKFFFTYRKNSENSLWSSILDWFFEGYEWWEDGAASY